MNPYTISTFGVILATILGVIFLKNKVHKNESGNNNLYGWKISGKKNHNEININLGEEKKEENKKTEKHDNKKDIEFLKKITNILFVDDEEKYTIVRTLKKMGWENTKIVKDISNLDKHKNVDIFFVDINGVGKKLGFKDEGLDLVCFIKHNFPNKKVVFYSSDTHRDFNHEAFKLADGQLGKDSRPYEFSNYIEQFAKEIQV